MQARPGPAFRPEEWVRGYSREQILAHVGECLEIFAELDEKHEINPAIAPTVFSTIQTMVASVEATPDAIQKAQTRAQLAGAGVSPLGIAGG